MLIAFYRPILGLFNSIGQGPRESGLNRLGRRDSLYFMEPKLHYRIYTRQFEVDIRLGGDFRSP
jgi:hypothetical protein